MSGVGDGNDATLTSQQIPRKGEAGCLRNSICDVRMMLVAGSVQRRGKLLDIIITALKTIHLRDS